MKKQLLFLVLIVASVFLSACEYAIDEQVAIEMATNAALGTPPEPLYQTAAAIYLNLTLTPTPQPTPYGTPTMSAIEYAATQAEQIRADNLTQQARDYALEQEKIAAQERAEAARLEAERAEKTAQAVDAIRTANAAKTQRAEQVTAQAQAVEWTAQAQATATQQALTWQQSTQAAQAAETARVEPTHAVLTATAVYLENRIKEGQAREVELAVRRTEMTNGLRAFGAWFALAFLMIVSSDGFKKILKTRVFKRDEHGKMPVISMEADNGKKVVVRPDLFASPALSMDDQGNVEQPRISEPGEQSEVTRRAQAIDAISMLPQPYAKQGVKMANAEFGGGQKAPQIFIRNNPAMGPVIDEAETQFMEETV